MKIAFGMIVFEGDYVLKECLECVYPFAEQILIAEGPVQFWQDEGKTTSEDNTNEILRNFPDPDGKIKIVHGQFSEKDEQCNAYMQFLNDDIDYFWQIDSDELWKAEDVKKIIKVLEKEKYTSVDVKSCSFYGGFDRYIGGFERQKVISTVFLKFILAHDGSHTDLQLWDTSRARLRYLLNISMVTLFIMNMVYKCITILMFSLNKCVIRYITIVQK